MQDPNQLKRRRIIVLSVLVGVVLLIFIGWLSTRGTDIDSRPFEGTAADYSTQARIVNGDDVFNKFGNDDAYDSLRSDVYYFGKNTYDKYKNSNTIIGFEVKGKVEGSDKEIKFSGNYGANSNKVTISVQLLPNNRIKTSITDTTTSTNLDDKLPSNSTRNQYISTLPIKKANYEITYLQSEDGFSVVVTGNVAKSQEEAINDIKAGLKTADVSKEKISFVIPTSSGEGVVLE